MNNLLITPPTALAVSLEAARRTARVSGTALDAELQGKVEGITEEVEHLTRRALVHQTWSMTLDAFPDGAIKLPPTRLASVDHVQFYDTTGALRTLDPLDYQVDTKSEPGFVLPAPGRTWPATAAIINAVEVRYVCGYGPDDASVPKAIQDYILGMLENQYYPNDNVQYLPRRLDRYVVYG
jgi:uncharacterized phiE125 gp8 family phage protein